MNTEPDNETLALWVEDELDPATTAKVDQWAADHADWLAQRDLARRSRNLLSRALPAEEPVPHGEFFNARIQREIEQSAPPKTSAPAPVSQPWRWLVPLTAAAGIALGFFLGRGPVPETPPNSAQATSSPVLYTPNETVQAEHIPADDATLIVLKGVPDIPDSWSLPATAALEPEAPAMATHESP